MPRLPVEILAFPQADLLDIAGALSVFKTANECLVRTGGAAVYAITVVADEPKRVMTSGGLELAVEPLPHAGAKLDTLIVAGGPGVHQAMKSSRLTTWVKLRSGKARRTVSVCTGAFLLGAAGLLDGRRAVTHWTRCAELAQIFPKAKVESDPIFIEDGRIWTSAGVTSGIDLSLALVEKDLGRSVALDVARQLVVFFKRPGGQAQFSATLALQNVEDRFGTLHHWISSHLADDLSLRVLADKGRNERAQLQPALFCGDGTQPGTGCGAVAPRSGAPAPVRYPHAHEAGGATLRLQLGGNHAPQLRSHTRHHAIGISKRLRPLIPPARRAGTRILTGESHATRFVA